MLIFSARKQTLLMGHGVRRPDVIAVLTLGSVRYCCVILTGMSHQRSVARPSVCEWAPSRRTASAAWGWHVFSPRIALIGLIVLRMQTVALFADEIPVDTQFTASDRAHWAYLPVDRPPLPAVANRDWIRTPIDNFVLAKLEQQGWHPSPEAEPGDWLRRLYLDLIGLPPTLAEQDRFLADPNPERYAEEADALLRRPGYGERWGRHWLDLVRYAESNGYERDAEKPHVWRYRDYVIDSLNNDKRYDRFVLEQLAGDELPNRSGETVIATGFYRLGPWDDEPADVAQDRHDQLDDMIRTTSQVFLGLTMGCARCHDHKFDALSMRDYYRMSAILAPLERPRSGRTDLDLPAGSREQLTVLAERDRQIEELQGEREQVRTAFQREYLATGSSQLAIKVVAAFQTALGDRSAEQRKLVSDHEAQLDAELEQHLPLAARRRIDTLGAQIDGLRGRVPDLPRGYFLREGPQEPPQSFVLLRGRAASPGPAVEPGLPAVLVRRQPPFERAERTSGRRLSMAKWVVHPENPLTARVIVNRVWQYHFGEGIVRTPSDFGVMGDSPTHPQLLDWLAYWFVHEANWSLKRLHRLIVRSSTYRMSKSNSSAYAAVDPENRLLWRFPYRRLQVEVIRDSMLASSGRLNRRMGGPAVKLDIPAVVVEGHADRDKIWKPSDTTAQSRRTVYAFVKRSLVVPILEVLDLPDTTHSTERRNITSVAPQALTLFNGDFVNRQAEHLAERVLVEVGSDPRAQITRAWRLSLCRPPGENELGPLMKFWEAEVARAPSELATSEAHRLALIQVCRVIYNLNEFAYSN